MGGLRKLVREPVQKLRNLAFAENVKHTTTAFPVSLLLFQNTGHPGHVFRRRTPGYLKEAPRVCAEDHENLHKSTQDGQVGRAMGPEGHLLVDLAATRIIGNVTICI